MPTTRQKRERHQRHRVTADAVQAWRDEDAVALHRALGLNPSIAKTERYEAAC